MSGGEHDAIADDRGEAVEVGGGTTIEVAPLRTRQIPAFARAIRPLMPALQNAIDVKGGETAQIDIDVIELMADHGDRLIEAVAVATGRSADEIGDLELDALIDVARKVLEVNLDFFAQRLLPAFMGSIDTLNSLLEKSPALSGQTPSKGSSAQATAGKKSSN